MPRSIAPASSQCQLGSSDLVDAVAVAVVGLQHRQVALGAPGVCAGLGAAGCRTRFAQALHTPPPALTLE